MEIKKYIIILVIFLASLCLFPKIGFADDADDTKLTTQSVIDGMSGIGSADPGTSNSSRIVGIINAVIKLIQFAGSGIALVVVTMQGAKYMLASAGEKADIKKQAIPIVIGCFVLFAAVNLVGIVADIGNGLNDDKPQATPQQPGPEYNRGFTRQ